MLLHYTFRAHAETLDHINAAISTSEDFEIDYGQVNQSKKVKVDRSHTNKIDHIAAEKMKTAE